MQLDHTDILHIAALARLELSDAEVEQYRMELSQVFDYIRMLDDVDVSGIEETTQVTGLVNVVREDIPEPISKEDRNRLLSAFPQRNGDLLTVKAVFDNSVE